MTSELRAAGIRAEMYLGSSGMNAQMKYADRRNAAAAVIVGSNERAAGQVTIKDLAAGAEAAKAIKDNAEYKAAKVGQWTAARADLVAELSKIPAIARHASHRLMAAKSPSERRAALIRLVEAKTVTRVTPGLLLPPVPISISPAKSSAAICCSRPPTMASNIACAPISPCPSPRPISMRAWWARPAPTPISARSFGRRTPIRSRPNRPGSSSSASPMPMPALDQVLTFARWALAIYDISDPRVRLGGVGLFEALLASMDISPQWQSRIRHRFGHPNAMARLMERLTATDVNVAGTVPDARESIVEIITDNMLSAGLSLVGSRLPDEIADRYLEKQALDAAPIPEAMVQLLVDYFSVADSAQQALDTISALTQAAGINLEGPLNMVRTHAAALARARAARRRDLRRQLLAAPRLLHRHRLRDDHRGRTDPGIRRRV